MRAQYKTRGKDTVIQQCLEIFIKSLLKMKKFAEKNESAIFTSNFCTLQLSLGVFQQAINHLACQSANIYLIIRDYEGSSLLAMISHMFSRTF